MDIKEEVGIFCLSHNNPSKREKIRSIFASQGLTVEFYNGVSINDPRIEGRPLAENSKRAWSIMYGHLDMLKLFVESGKKYGIMCEDDILVRKDFGANLTHIVSDFTELNLDVLLLSYLCSNPGFNKYSNFPERKLSDYSRHPFKYYAYDSNPASAVWGAQMYMLHRHQAIFLLDKYSNGYADKTIHDKSLVHFSSDWTITKEGTKAIIYPLMAIENADVEYDDKYQGSCRKKCYDIFYSPDLFGANA